MLLLGRSSQPRRARPVNDGLEHPSRAWATSGIARGHKSAVSSLGETAGLLLRPVGEKKGEDTASFYQNAADPCRCSKETPPQVALGRTRGHQNRSLRGSILCVGILIP